MIYLTLVRACESYFITNLASADLKFIFLNDFRRQNVNPEACCYSYYKVSVRVYENISSVQLESFILLKNRSLIVLNAVSKEAGKFQLILTKIVNKKCKIL